MGKHRSGDSSTDLQARQIVAMASHSRKHVSRTISACQRTEHVRPCELRENNRVTPRGRNDRSPAPNAWECTIPPPLTTRNSGNGEGTV